MSAFTARTMRFTVLGLLPFLMQPLCAESFLNTSRMTPLSSVPYVASVSLGSVWSTRQNTQTLELAPNIVKLYTNGDSNSAALGSEIFFGIQKPLSNQLTGQLGLAVATTSNTKYNGNIWDDADPLFDNFTYQYNVQHTALRMKGKLISNKQYYGVSPWINAGLGIAWNDAKNYNNTPTIFEALPNPNFSNHMNTAFTYNLGLGIQHSLTSHITVGAGYDFADWGSFSLGRASGQTSSRRLSGSHTYTNGLLFNLTYVA